MLRSIRHTATLMSAIALLTACSNGQLETTSGSVTMGFHYETVDLPLLLDPDGAAAAHYGSGWDKLDDAKKNDLARTAYHKWETQAGSDAAVISRNQIQDRLIGASNQLCHNYELYMQDLSSQGNFWAGLATTAAATAGALFSGGTSQIFAGAAAVISGGRAEFNQDFFYKEAVPAIFKGIRAKRSEILQQISTKRAADNVASNSAPVRNRASTLDYTLEAAIGDVIDYHWNCSLASGIAHLGSLATLAEEVGKKTALGALENASNDRQVSGSVAALLSATTQAQAAMAAGTKTFEASLAATKLAKSSESIMAGVNARLAKSLDKVKACGPKAVDAATAISTAQQALVVAKPAEAPVKQQALDAALSSGRVVTAKIGFGADRYADEVTALRPKLEALPSAADGTIDKATIDAELKKAFAADPADLSC